VGRRTLGRRQREDEAGADMFILVPQDTGLYYHRYLQEVINVLETDGHFREKLQAANAEDIKVQLGTWRAGVPVYRTVFGLRGHHMSPAVLPK
jgi:hypothetical protein